MRVARAVHEKMTAVEYRGRLALPFTRNYAPSDDLSPYIRQYYVFEGRTSPKASSLIDESSCRRRRSSVSS